MSFTYLFYQHIMFRPSCGKCHYANTKRPSDITIADVWGWDKTDPNINAIPAKLEDCLQPNLCRPSLESHLRCKFEKDYRKYGFKYVYYRYGNIGPIWRLRQIKAFFKKNLRLR